MDLLIVESPNKIKKISKILGSNFVVKASVGHFRDLPKKDFGVDLDTFYPKYELESSKMKVIAGIRKQAKQATNIYLSTDPDREGEAIAWHIQYIIGAKGKTAKRAAFQEITEKAVKNSIRNAGVVDMNLVNAQQARRVLDRVVGYLVSPKLWPFGKGLSAGRVQSATLHLIVTREKERLNFKPVEYWVLKVKYDNGLIAEYAEKVKDTFQAKKLDSEDKVISIIKKATDNKHFIESVESKPVTRKPPPPFTTSTLQQAASSSMNIKPDKCMKLAQSLFEQGRITYHRTDSVSLSEPAIELARSFLKEKFPEGLPNKPSVYKSKSGAQEAHEAIRPTSLDSNLGLEGEELKLYLLIVKRFIASQCKPAVFEKTTVITKADNLNFIAIGSVLKFKGFLKFYNKIDESDKNFDDELQLKQVSKGEELKPLDFSKDKKFTQPPPRFTEASLIKEMEKKGIGRPSTYAQSIKTLFTRKYIKNDKKTVCPTELGFFVDNLLEKGFYDLIQDKYTAEMEKKLDEIASGDVNWTAFLKNWYNSFKEQLKNSEDIFAQLGKEKGIELNKSENKVENKVVVNDVKCPECNLPMINRKSKYGNFLGCSAFPKCKGTIFPKRKNKIAKGKTCPECNSEMNIQKSKKGFKFFGCSKYPDCKGVIWPESKKKATKKRVKQQ